MKATFFQGFCCRGAAIGSEGQIGWLREANRHVASVCDRLKALKRLTNTVTDRRYKIWADAGSARRFLVRRFNSVPLSQESRNTPGQFPLTAAPSSAPSSPGPGGDPAGRVERELQRLMQNLRAALQKLELMGFPISSSPDTHSPPAAIGFSRCPLLIDGNPRWIRQRFCKRDRTPFRLSLGSPISVNSPT